MTTGPSSHYSATFVLERYRKDPDLTRLLFFSCLERHELADLFFERQVQQFLQVGVRLHSPPQSRRWVSPGQRGNGRSRPGRHDAYQGLIELLYPGRFGQAELEARGGRMVTMCLNGVVARS